MTATAAPVTVSVIVTAHSEGTILRPTLRSVEAAVAEVVSRGGTAELVLVCDRADARTLEEARRGADAFATTARVIETDLGEPGAARNAGAEAAEGQHLAFVDGDDLISPNFVTAALEVIGRTSGPVVVHPHRVFSFGARRSLWETAENHGEVDYRDLLRFNLWPSTCVAPRSVVTEVPFRPLRLDLGFGPEDWLWNIDSTIAGARHTVAPDTLLSYRVRATGGVNNRHDASVLPAIDLDGLRAAMPAGISHPPSLPRRLYAALRPLARRLSRGMSPEAKRRLYRTATGAFLRRKALPPGVAEALAEATALDPAISRDAGLAMQLDVVRQHDDGYGAIFDGAVQAIGDRPGALLLVDSFAGSAGLTAIASARALESAGLRTVVLALRSRDHQAPTDGVDVVRLPARFGELDRRLRARLLAQLIVQVAPRVTFAIESVEFADCLRGYARQLGSVTDITATLTGFSMASGFPIHPLTDDAPHREHLTGIAVITHDTTTAETVRLLLASDALVHVVPAPDEDGFGAALVSALVG